MIDGSSQHPYSKINPIVFKIWMLPFLANKTNNPNKKRVPRNSTSLIRSIDMYVYTERHSKIIKRTTIYSRIFCVTNRILLGGYCIYVGIQELIKEK